MERKGAEPILYYEILEYLNEYLPDDIGIVSNITSIISKEERIMMRSINIDSHDGLFSGNLVVNIDDTSRLEQLIRKLKTVKGVKQVTRL